MESYFDKQTMKYAVLVSQQRFLSFLLAEKEYISEELRLQNIYDMHKFSTDRSSLMPTEIFQSPYKSLLKGFLCVIMY